MGDTGFYDIGGNKVLAIDINGDREATGDDLYFDVADTVTGVMYDSGADALTFV